MNLTIVNDGHGTTNPTGVVSVVSYSSYPINALPLAGYRFLNWTVTSGVAAIANTNNPSTTIMLFGLDAVIQANFIINVTYELPDVTIKGEVYSIGFISPIAGLTVPTENMLVSMGNRNEKLEGDPDNPTNQTIQNMDFEFIDKGNFFSSLLASPLSPCTVQVIRNETLLEFSGEIDIEAKEFPETYVNATTARRHVTFNAASSLMRLDTIDIGTMVDAIKASAYLEGTPSPANCVYLSADRMFAEFMLQLNTTDPDLTLPIINNHDFKYYKTQGGDEVPWEDVHINTADAAFDDFIGSFKTAKELLIALARNFGFAPIVFMDGENNCYRLKLLTQRSHAAASGTFQNLKPGSTKISIKKPNAVLFTHQEDVAGMYIKNRTWKTFSGAEPDDAPESYDRETELYFAVSPLTANLYYMSSGSGVPIEAMTYYDYFNKQWSDTPNGYQETYAVITFRDYFFKIWNMPQSGYKRSMKGFTENELGIVIEMHDGTSLKNYIAFSFERDYMNKEENYELAEV